MQLQNKVKQTIRASGLRVGVAASRFNEEITAQLCEAAVAELVEAGVKKADIKIVSVPGAIELPYALQKLARTKKFDALVAIGCVIRGETPHFDYVCKMAQEGVLRVSLDSGIPIGFGVLTVESVKQAKARIHVGAEAAAAAAELVLLKV